MAIKGGLSSKLYVPIESIHLINAREAFGVLKIKRNILKYAVILSEHLAPQYWYYRFSLLKSISRDYVTKLRDPSMKHMKRNKNSLIKF